MAQCADFIHNKDLREYDESSAKSLKEAMLKNKGMLVQANG